MPITNANKYSEEEPGKEKHGKAKQNKEKKRKKSNSNSNSLHIEKFSMRRTDRQTDRVPERTKDIGIL
jgi:hypothetical protein